MPDPDPFVIPDLIRYPESKMTHILFPTHRLARPFWIPASAGMTGGGSGLCRNDGEEFRPPPNT